MSTQHIFNKGVQLKIDPKPLSMRRNVLWTIAGNGVYMAAYWAQTAAIAKLSSPQHVGTYAAAIALVQPIIIFSQLQLRAVIATDVKEKYSFNDYLFVRLLTTLLALIVIFIASVISKGSLQVKQVLFWIGCVTAIESMSDIYHGRFQHHRRMDIIAISIMMRGVLMLIALIVGFSITKSLSIGSIAMTVAASLVLCFYDIPMNKRYAATENTKCYADGGEMQKSSALGRRVLSIFWLALPLGAIVVLNSLKYNMSRYAIMAHLSEVDLGVFSALSALIGMPKVIVSAIGQSASTPLAIDFQNRSFRRFWYIVGIMIAIALAIGVVFIVGAAVAGRQVISLVYRPEYVCSPALIFWLVIGNTIANISTFLGVALTSARAYKSQLPFAILSLIAVVIANSLLVPRLGLMGAAYATVITAMVTLVGNVFVLLRRMRVPGNMFE